MHNARLALSELSGQARESEGVVQNSRDTSKRRQSTKDSGSFEEHPPAQSEEIFFNPNPALDGNT
jgi:hypothetical protein